MSLDYDYDRDDPTFVADLMESRSAVELAAKWLAARGYAVIVRPTFVRPSVSEINEYSDDGDLEILQRVEVKRRRSAVFTSKDDYPYPTVIVDTCRAFDRAKTEPYAYMIFNRDKTAGLVIEVRATKKHWRRVLKHDKQKGRDTEFYECPIGLCVNFDPSIIPHP